VQQIAFHSGGRLLSISGGSEVTLLDVESEADLRDLSKLSAEELARRLRDHFAAVGGRGVRC
jgi:hypothetical protein